MKPQRQALIRPLSFGDGDLSSSAALPAFIKQATPNYLSRFYYECAHQYKVV